MFCHQRPLSCPCLGSEQGLSDRMGNRPGLEAVQKRDLAFAALLPSQEGTGGALTVLKAALEFGPELDARFKAFPPEWTF